MKSFRTILSAGFLASALVLAGCGGGGSEGGMDDAQMEAEKKAAEELAARQADQRMAITDAVMMAQTAVNAVGNDSDQGVVDNANAAVMALKDAIGDAADLATDDAVLVAAGASLTSIESSLMASLNARQMAMDAADKAAQDAADKAAMEAAEAARMMAAKLYTAIANGSGGATTAYVSGAFQIDLDGAGSDHEAETLKGAMAGMLGTWDGETFTASGDGGMYTAQVYSNKDDPTPGAKFNAQYTLISGETGATAYRNGAVAVTTSSADEQSRVMSSSFDQSAGKKDFELGENDVYITLSGSYHGVSGTYFCDPTATTCTATRADEGFALSGGTWHFKPSDPEARLMSTPDSSYASFGWWTHENGDSFTVESFAIYNGTAPAVTSLDSLHGDASYSGKAAGKYAVSRGAGAENDSGHFTADAKLSATFGSADADRMISGTIDNFMGADGMSRDWSVSLNETQMSAAGATDATNMPKTVWTMGMDDGKADGSWSATLYGGGLGADGMPDGTGADGSAGEVPAYGIGTFSSEYGNIGHMTGAFGVDRD